MAAFLGDRLWWLAAGPAPLLVVPFTIAVLGTAAGRSKEFLEGLDQLEVTRTALVEAQERAVS